VISDAIDVTMEEQTTALLQFSTENVINVFQNEPVLWNSDLNASEEDKELAWCRLCDVFGFKSAGKYRMV